MRVYLKGDTFFIVQYFIKEASKGGGGGEEDKVPILRRYYSFP
jgi:hypothetical protein